MNLFKDIVNPWVVVGAVILALCLTGIMVVAVLWRQGENTPTLPLTAELNLTPAPTSTEPGLRLATPTQTTTPDTPPSPLPGVIAPGSFVQIVGTGGRGLNLRAEPDLDAQIDYLGLESEVFEVQEGPVESDGFSWWFLVSFSDPTRRGWGAANFLEVIQE